MHSTVTAVPKNCNMGNTSPHTHTQAHTHPHTDTHAQSHLVLGLCFVPKYIVQPCQFKNYKQASQLSLPM